MHKKIALLCISLIACNKITAADWWLEEHAQTPVAQHAEKVVAQSAPAAPVIELPEESSSAQQWLRRVEVVVAGVVGVAAVCWGAKKVKPYVLKVYYKFESEAAKEARFARKVAERKRKLAEEVRAQEERSRAAAAEPQTNECMSCFDSENLTQKTVCCKQPVHQDCLFNWLQQNNTCPHCRVFAPNLENI